MSSKVKSPSLEYHVVEIPVKERRNNAIGIFLISYFLSIFAAVEYGGKGVLVVWIVGLIAGLAVFFLKTHKRVLTPDSEKIVAETEAEKKETPKEGIALEADELFIKSSWYIRYPITVIVLAVAVWYANSHPHFDWKDWGIIGFAILYSIALGRELAYWGFICWGAYYLITSVASLPVSAAIIVGAVIIAMAIKSR